MKFIAAILATTLLLIFLAETTPPYYEDVSTPYHVIGKLLVFYKGTIPGPIERAPNIQTIDKAIAAELRIKEVLQSYDPRIQSGNIILISWLTDVGPCFQWEITPGIQKGDVVEVKNTGSMCNSFMRTTHPK